MNTRQTRFIDRLRKTDHGLIETQSRGRLKLIDTLQLIGLTLCMNIHNAQHHVRRIYGGPYRGDMALASDNHQHVVPDQLKLQGVFGGRLRVFLLAHFDDLPSPHQLGHFVLDMLLLFSSQLDWLWHSVWSRSGVLCPGSYEGQSEEDCQEGQGSFHRMRSSGSGFGRRMGNPARPLRQSAITSEGRVSSEKSAWFVGRAHWPVRAGGWHVW